MGEDREGEGGWVVWVWYECNNSFSHSSPFIYFTLHMNSVIAEKVGGSVNISVHSGTYFCCGEVKICCFPPLFFSPTHHINSPSLLLFLPLSTTGVRSLLLLKTTQSGFENFHRDEFRALGDTNDRLVGTSVDGEWTFTPAAIASRPDYEALNKLVLNTLIDEFAGPADKGVYSVSVQQTLYDMGTGLLAKVPGVEKIELYMVRSLPPSLPPLFRLMNHFLSRPSLNHSYILTVFSLPLSSLPPSLPLAQHPQHPRGPVQVQDRKQGPHGQARHFPAHHRPARDDQGCD